MRYDIDIVYPYSYFTPLLEEKKGITKIYLRHEKITPMGLPQKFVTKGDIISKLADTKYNFSAFVVGCRAEKILCPHEV